MPALPVALAATAVMGFSHAVVGAALGGAGLALAGDVGLAAALAVPTALAAVLVRPATVADP